jgi:hypothetical protein
MDYPFKYTAEDIIEFYQVFDKHPNRDEFVKAMLQEYDAMRTCDVVLIWQCFEYAEYEGKQIEREKIISKLGIGRRSILASLIDGVEGRFD